MPIDRRQFLIYLTAATVTVSPVLMTSKGANDDMYGLIAKLTTVPAKREELIRILSESAANMPGCFSYVVAKDSADENVIWVTEVWDSEASHDASLSLPAVKNAKPQAKPIVAAFEKVATTNPVWGVGLPPAAH
jgi:quinol monooxygenase YgiN